MNQYQEISPERKAALESDIATRIKLRRTRAEHERPILQIELGVSVNTITAIERGETMRSSLPSWKVMEIRRRRNIYWLTNEHLQDYTLDALAEKHGVCRGTVVNYTQRMRAKSAPARMAA